MSLDFALLDVDLARVPDRPGAIVLFDDVNPLYVAQTANMRAWIRRLLDTGRQDNTRAAIAKYLANTRTDLVHLRSLPGLNEQVMEFLNFCRVRLHPEDSREAAIERKASLVSSLSPKLQTSTGKTTVPVRPSRPSQRSRSEDPIVKLLTRVGRLTHIDRAGRPRMVDVGAKADTAREAVARGSVYMAPETLALVVSGRAAKGDVLTTAQLAGIMAAKRTHELIPLCHPLPLTAIDVSLAPDEARSAIDITATVRTTARTGVEMEALTAVSVAALTVYDMLKAAQRDIRIGDIRLARKSGGKSGKIALE